MARAGGPSRTSARRRMPRPVLTATLLLVAIWVLGVGGGVGPLSGKLADVQKNDNASFLPAGAESTRVLDLQGRFSSADVIPATVVYERGSGVTAEDRARAQADADRFAAVPGLVGRPSPPLPSQDGKALQVIVPLDSRDGEQIIDAVDGLRAVARSSGGLDVYVTGIAGLSADLFGAFGGIDTKLLGTTAVVVIVILLLVYRSPLLWIVPLLSAGLAYAAAAGMVYVLAKNDVLTLNGQSQGILTVLVFGAGTDYALLIVSRYREELHRHESAWGAMRVALRGAVPAVVASGATVVISLLCLLVSQLNSNRSLGPVCAIGIVAALLAMTTFLPSVLVLTGRLLFWPRVPHFDSPEYEGAGLWRRVADVVGRRARPIWLATSVVLLLLTVGITQLDSGGLSTAESFTTRAESVVGQEVVAAHFPAGGGSPAVVIGRAGAADALLAAVRGVPGVADATFITDSPQQQGAPQAGPTRPKVVDGLVEVDATLQVAADSVEANDVVERLRSTVRGVPGADALVGGFTAINDDVQRESQRDNRVIIPLVLLVIFAILALLLRSLVAPLLLVATVVLSFAATLGVCGVVFRHVFHFAGEDSSFPLFAFVFLVALGIDYNIFLMTRVREESLRLGTRPGVLKGLAVTGGVITSAGVVLAATFAVLGVLPLVFLAEIGFAVAFGVLLDTLVVRSLLVPALAYDAGERIWWPGRLRRGRHEKRSARARQPATVG